MKTKNQKQLLKRFAKWLKQPENSPASLATKLGFKTSFTVTQWIYRGNIPQKHRATVKAIIEGAQ